MQAATEVLSRCGSKQRSRIKKGLSSTLDPHFGENPNHMTENRRRRPRLKLAYAVQLCRPGDALPVNTQTENLSSEGFYCKSDQPFSPGEHLECSLLIPPPEFGSRRPNLILHRRVSVVRVEIKGLEPGFGIACKFEDGLKLRENGQILEANHA